jgi:general secretion pathway protein L
MKPMTSPSAARPAPFDVGATLRALLQPWRELHLWPPLSWLTPLPQVRLLQADGAESLWAGDTRVPGGAGSVRAVRFTAVELPESLRLECRLNLPPMPGAQVRDAVALEVRSASPFDPSDLVWGWRAQSGAGKSLAVVAVLASRRAVERQIGALAERLGAAAQPEVWALGEDGRAIVIQGYGESARQQSAARGRLLAAALLAAALALAVAAAVTPTAQIKLRAMQAARATQEAERQMAPLLAQREQLVRTLGELEALREAMGDHIESLAVMDALTQLIPDDTWLQRLQVQGAKVTVSGQAPNAAALMNTLSSHPGVRDVKAPAAATRSMAGGRENFTIEWTLAPELLRPSLAATPGRPKP